MFLAIGGYNAYIGHKNDVKTTKIQCLSRGLAHALAAPPAPNPQRTTAVRELLACDNG